MLNVENTEPVIFRNNRVIKRTQSGSPLPSGGGDAAAGPRGGARGGHEGVRRRGPEGLLSDPPGGKGGPGRPGWLPACFRHFLKQTSAVDGVGAALQGVEWGRGWGRSADGGWWKEGCVCVEIQRGVDDGYVTAEGALILQKFQYRRIA